MLEDGALKVPVFCIDTETIISSNPENLKDTLFYDDKVSVSDYYIHPITTNPTSYLFFSLNELTRYFSPLIIFSLIVNRGKAVFNLYKLLQSIYRWTIWTGRIVRGCGEPYIWFNSCW